MKSILVIGGYGSAGSIVSDLLMKHTDYIILIGGRNFEKATIYSNELNFKYQSQRCFPICLDLRHELSFDNIDLVVIAAPAFEYFQNIVSTVEKYNCTCIDLTPPTSKAEKHLPDKTKNLYVVDVGGMFPLTMIKYCQLKNMLIANVYNSYEINWNKINHSAETVPEFDNSKAINSKKKSLYINSKWYTIVDIPVVSEDLDGTQQLFETFYFSDIELTTKLYPSVIETGCFHRINDCSISDKGEKTILKARVENAYEKKNMFIKCISGYFLTAAGAVATILQCIEDEKSMGVYTAGEYLDAEIFFTDLKEKMQIEVYITDD